MFIGLWAKQPDQTDGIYKDRLLISEYSEKLYAFPQSNIILIRSDLILQKGVPLPNIPIPSIGEFTALCFVPLIPCLL